ncbi:aminoglycoside phosphotransferase family protein [Pseudalkalibacillus sp. SCS-8]|uniref:phosphotransferase family protein n=1 Tax=Pseudalkalibacillus nanhaiensis TaxID=3115291 RepID=UPI0032DA05AC
MKHNIHLLLQAVKKECEQICSLIDITPFASGVENCVFSATTEEWGTVVIRVPWVRTEVNGEIESRKGLEKEYELTKLCYAQGLPAPKIYAFHKSDRVDFIIQAFIAHEENVVILNEEIGSFTYRLHNIEPSTTSFLQNAHHVLPHRIVERTKAAEQVLGHRLPIPEPSELESIFQAFPTKNRLLHLDIRPENLIFGKKGIKAVFDWTNAMIGDPVLELMRIKVYGYLNEEFVKGYTPFRSEMDRVPDLVKWLYQYDTTVMLTLLFLTELDDHKQGEEARNRLLDLHRKIKMNV